MRTHLFFIAFCALAPSGARAQEGALDLTFDIGAGANGTVHAIAVQSDGKIIIAGDFSSYDGNACGRVARLNADGSWDSGFNTGTGASASVRALVIQPDGKVLIGGYFTSVNGSNRGRIARLHNDGSLDTGFDTSVGANGAVLTIALQPDGRSIIGGWFSTFSGFARGHLARLNTNGTLDTGFNPGTGTNAPVFCAVVQPDGRILIGGSFTTYNGNGRIHIARVLHSGAIDPGFLPGTGTDLGVDAIGLQPDGDIIIGGSFTTYNDIPRERLGRILTDGMLDASFDPGLGAIGGTVYSTVLLPDGRSYINGYFVQYDGVVRQRICRVEPDGSVDPSFDPGTGANDLVKALAVQPDGRVLVGGDLTQYNGTGRNRIARLIGTARTTIRVLLEGPYNGSLMTDALRSLPSFPLTEPFTAMGYAETAFVPGASIPPSLLTTTGNNAIVDWVIVEMRPAATPNVVAASRAVLLQRDGDVVDLDGVSTVGFAGLAHGNYCVAVKPRTHLPVMLSASTPFAYGTSTTAVDFALPATQVHDADARKDAGGVMVLATGDATFNEELSYVGNGNDRDPILLRVGGSTPSNVVSGYWPEDVNMDGVVKYVGANNDRDPILLNVGGSTPTATRNAQLP
jgi:uncharacterized delta-60 repeat protein